MWGIQARRGVEIEASALADSSVGMPPGLAPQLGASVWLYAYVRPALALTHADVELKINVKPAPLLLGAGAMMYDTEAVAEAKLRVSIAGTVDHGGEGKRGGGLSASGHFTKVSLTSTLAVSGLSQGLGPAGSDDGAQTQQQPLLPGGDVLRMRFTGAVLRKDPVADGGALWELTGNAKLLDDLAIRPWCTLTAGEGTVVAT